MPQPSKPLSLFGSSNAPTVFGLPLLLEVPDACTYRDLRTILWARVRVTFQESDDLPVDPPDYFTLSVCKIFHHSSCLNKYLVVRLVKNLFWFTIPIYLVGKSQRICMREMWSGMLCNEMSVLIRLYRWPIRSIVNYILLPNLLASARVHWMSRCCRRGMGRICVYFSMFSMRMQRMIRGYPTPF